MRGDGCNDERTADGVQGDEYDHAEPTFRRHRTAYAAGRIPVSREKSRAGSQKW